MKTISGGAVASPDQLGNLSFSLPAPDTRVQFQFKATLRPPSEYIKSRIRKGLELYQRGGNVLEVDASLVLALANTVTGKDPDYQPTYHPIYDADVLFELESMKIIGKFELKGARLSFHIFSAAFRTSLYPFPTPSPIPHNLKWYSHMFAHGPILVLPSYSAFAEQKPLLGSSATVTFLTKTVAFKKLWDSSAITKADAGFTVGGL